MPPSRAASGSWRKGLFLAFCVLVTAGIASAVYWPQLSGLLAKPSGVQQAGADLADKPPEPDKPPPDSVAQAPPPKPVLPPKPLATPPDPPKAIDPPKPLDPIKPPVKPPDPVKPPPRPVDPVPQPMAFPRRALVVSVNNYLYANPVHFGTPGRTSRNAHTLLERLHNGLRIPMDQMALLSDAAPGNTARPPFKSIIEKTVADFLTTSREQDRVVVLFIGHAVEIEDEAYLVPLEGELDVKETLIPLKWLYERLAGSRARQKVLVLDVCRLNPSRGQERPGSGPLGAKLDAILKQPPAGVQVWTACVAEQYSYEFEYLALNNGLFQDALHDVLGQPALGNGQKPDETLPVEGLVERVNQRMKEVLDREQKVQTSRLTGQEPPAGVAPDRSQPRPPTPAIDAPRDGAADAAVVKGILSELDLPSLKPGPNTALQGLEGLPMFSAKALEAYRDDGQKTPFREAVLKTRDVLNQQVRGKQLRHEFRAPVNENRFKEEIKDYQRREVATLLDDLMETLEDLKAAGKKRDKEMSKRWQAHYDYLLARLQMQIAYLYEYSTILGSIRQELPPRDPAVHGGWRLVAKPDLQGDAAGKQQAREARQVLEQLAKDHPGTPWEVLAKRERFTALGLGWEPVK